MSKQLIEGNEAVVLGALLGGATHFFGYPITPASEIAHAAARYFPGAERHFLQAESEVSAINDKYRIVEQELVEFEETGTNDADVLLVAYGISARICFSALKTLRDKGIKAGLVRPQTLFPFPRKRLRDLAAGIRACIVVELSNGQMAEDVERAVAAQCPVIRYNWFGGIIPSIREIVERVTADMSGTLK